MMLKSSTFLLAIYICLISCSTFVNSQDTNATVAPTNATDAPTNATDAPTNATVAPTNATDAPTTVAPTNATMMPTNLTDLLEQLSPTMMPTNKTMDDMTANKTEPPKDMNVTDDTMMDDADETDGEDDTDDADEADEADAGDGDMMEEEGTCGFGSVGNGICFNPDLCCSDSGHCDDCDASAAPSKLGILAAMSAVVGTSAISMI